MQFSRYMSYFLLFDQQRHIRTLSYIQLMIKDLCKSGSHLLSRAVSSQVPSALKGLTSVFGMGTGGSPSPLPPEFLGSVLRFALA